MKTKIIILSVFSLIFSVSCRMVQGNLLKDERNVGSFIGIKSCCSINVYISEGNSNKIYVEADEKIINNIITEVKNNILNISIHNDDVNKSFWETRRMNVYVEIQNLRSIQATSTSDIRSNGSLKTKDISLTATSGAYIRLDIEAENITCKLSSGADIVLNGSADFTKISVSSGADIKMKGMTVNKADISTNSGGSANILVKEDIKARASSGSSISYYGNPTHKDVSSRSGGSIKKK